MARVKVPEPGEAACCLTPCAVPTVIGSLLVAFTLVKAVRGKLEKRDN